MQVTRGAHCDLCLTGTPAYVYPCTITPVQSPGGGIVILGADQRFTSCVECHRDIQAKDTKRAAEQLFQRAWKDMGALAEIHRGVMEPFIRRLQAALLASITGKPKVTA